MFNFNMIVLNYFWCPCISGCSIPICPARASSNPEMRAPPAGEAFWLRRHWVACLEGLPSSYPFLCFVVFLMLSSRVCYCVMWLVWLFCYVVVNLGFVGFLMLSSFVGFVLLCFVLL